MPISHTWRQRFALDHPCEHADTYMKGPHFTTFCQQVTFRGVMLSTILTVNK
jgi:hypothetical protein